VLYAMLAVCAALIFVFVLAVPRAARASRLARLFRGQEAWAEMMDRKTQPHRQCPLAPPWRGPCDAEDDSIVPPAEGPALAVLLSGQPDGRR
jgi:hypothetical protein